MILVKLKWYTLHCLQGHITHLDTPQTVQQHFRWTRLVHNLNGAAGAAVHAAHMDTASFMSGGQQGPAGTQMAPGLSLGRAAGALVGHLCCLRGHTVMPERC